MNFSQNNWNHFTLGFSLENPEHPEVNPIYLSLILCEFNQKLHIILISDYEHLQGLYMFDLLTHTTAFAQYSLSNNTLIEYTPHTSGLIGEVLYVIFEGGHSAKISLNASEYYWQSYEKILSIRKGLSSALVNDRFISFGGWLLSNAEYVLNNQIFSYNFLKSSVTDESVLVPSFVSPTARISAAMCAIKGKLYLFGGKAKGYFLKDMWKYDPKANIWGQVTTSSVSPSERAFFASSCEGDALFVFGGEDSSGFTNDVFIYNSLTNVWSALEPLSSDVPSKRKGSCSVLRIPYAYITGGIDAHGLCSDLWRFNFGNNTYTKINVVPKNAYAACRLNNDVFHVVGGSDENDIPFASGFKYNLLTGELEYKNSTDRSFEIFIWLTDNITLTIGGRQSNNQVFNDLEYSVGDLSLQKFINDYPYASAYTYFNQSVYFFGGGYFTTEYNLFPYLPRPKFAKIDLHDLCGSAECQLPCSEGFYLRNSKCEECPPGNYSSGSGNTKCQPCEKGFYSFSEAVSSIRQCYPCPEGKFNDKEGGKMCYDCPPGSFCPTGSKTPLIFTDNNVSIFSVQPNLYKENNPNAIVKLLQYLGTGLICLVLIVVCSIRKLKDFIKKFDLYSTQHNHNDGDYIRIQKNTTGGVFSLIFFGLTLIVIGSVLAIYFMDNIYESKSLIPLVILESEVPDFKTNFEVLVKLDNYGDSCVSEGKINKEGKCSDLITLTSVNIDYEWESIACKIDTLRRCLVKYSCTNCAIGSKAAINLVFQEKLSYSSGISVNITSDSSIPESRSSVLSTVIPEKGYIFIGPLTNTFYFTFTPSYFTSSISNFPPQLIGYHVDSSALPKSGSQNLVENLSVTAQLSVSVVLEKILLGLYTSRSAKQSTLILISSLFGTITGLVGIVGTAMGQFESCLDKKFNLSGKEDRIKKIVQKSSEMFDMLVKSRENSEATPSDMSAQRSNIPLTGGGLSSKRSARVYAWADI